MDKSELLGLLNANSVFVNIKESTMPALRKRGLEFGWEFETAVCGKSVKLCIGFDQYFPLTKPEYFLVPFTALGHIPHVEKDGKICYTHEDYLAIDFENPKNVISESLLSVIETLRKGVTNENEVDFINEFEAYWGQIDNSVSILVNIEPDTSVKQIKLVERSKQVVCALDDEVSAIKLTRRLIGDSGVTYINAVYVPFELHNYFMPPTYNHEFSSGEVRDIIRTHISTQNWDTLIKQCRKLNKKIEYLVFSQIQPNGNVSFAGFKFSNIRNGVHPLCDPESESKVTTVNVARIDGSYLTRRGGNGITFKGKRGLVIGCGSIGSSIIEELVKVGLLNLTIADKEVLQFENGYRHSCGLAYRGKNKAKALKTKIESYYPHANIEALPYSLEDIALRKRTDFSTFDFIVVATGNVTINRYFNELLFKQYPRIATFFTWLEPYGLGGHCLVTNVGERGCYNCLYDNEVMTNSASFANSQQPKPFLKSISGCGSVYTPFSSLDVIETSLLTVRSILGVLENGIDHSVVYSWKGNPKVFLSEGFLLSKRFNLSPQELEQGQGDFISHECKACSNAKRNV